MSFQPPLSGSAGINPSHLLSWIRASPRYNRPTMIGTITIICPNCDDHAPYPATSKRSNFTCLKCGQKFSCVTAKMRAKRSRGNQSSETREFSLRVYVGNEERLIEFTNFSLPDFELRSGDEVIISYIGRRVALIHNLTINRWYKITERPFPFATIIILVIVILALIAVWANATRH